MLQGTSRLFASAVLGLAAAGAAQAQQPEAPGATGEIINSEGEVIGSVNVTQLAHGVLIIATAEGLPPGVRGFHIHETGQCDPPDFQSAGGHFNPTGAAHGFNNPDGPHAGDLPNVHVGEDGVLAVEFISERLTLDEGETAMLGGDGTALVIHDHADDHQTDPTGDAGPRIACAVIEAAPQ
jgi:superoxide dismutase, Cu-Zn family